MLDIYHLVNDFKGQGFSQIIAKHLASDFLASDIFYSENLKSASIRNVKSREYRPVFRLFIHN